MAYYDDIARQWHAVTGYAGGAFKELALNDALLRHLPGIEGRAILELGAGNGYFMPLVLRRFAGQVPAVLVVTDQSEALLRIARTQFRVPGATYQRLDVRQPFPFGAGQFDVVLASMLFNEVPNTGFRHALGECARVLAPGGRLLMAVLHPQFVHSLDERGVLKPTPSGVLTMPGADRLRLPVVIRSLAAYQRGLTEAGFEFEQEDVYPTEAVLSARAGLRHAQGLPLAAVFCCTASGVASGGATPEARARRER